MAQQIGTYTYSDPTSLANWVRGLLYLDIVVTAVLTISTFMQHALIQDILGGVYHGNPDLSSIAAASDLRQQIIGWVSTGVNIIGMILVLCWIYRVMANSWALTDLEMEFTPGWAIGWYFIPFANLIKPYHAMKEIWRENVASYEGEPRRNNLPLWWGLWISTGIISQISMRMAGSNNASVMMTGIQTSIVSDAMSIILNLVFLSIVHVVTTSQVARYERKENEELPDDEVQIAWE